MCRDECVGADAVVRPERSERPLQKIIGATQILVPARNPRRPAPKQRKNAAQAVGTSATKNYTSPEGAQDSATIQSIVMENAAVRNWRESFLLLNEDVVRILSRNAPELEREQHLVGTFDFVFSL